MHLERMGVGQETDNDAQESGDARLHAEYSQRATKERQCRLVREWEYRLERKLSD
jgi:hypothetical protein